MTAKFFIRIKLGTDKCATVAFKGGALDHEENMDVNSAEGISVLESKNFYQYLGVAECQGPDHPCAKENLRYTHRLRKILRSRINAKNKMTAIGTWVISVIRYSFCVVTGEWTRLGHWIPKPASC